MKWNTKSLLFIACVGLAGSALFGFSKGDDRNFRIAKNLDVFNAVFKELDMFKGYAYLYIEGYLVQDHDLILRAMQLAKEAGAQICLDMASYNIVAEELDFFTTLINKYVDIVFANEEEARAYTGKDAWEAINEISAMCSVVVVKLGAQGSCIKKGTECIKLEIPLVKKVVDTTGAGDYYAAGFLYGLTCGYSLEKCSIIGSILASNVIQVVGTTLSKKKWDEIKLNIEALLQS